MERFCRNSEEQFLLPVEVRVAENESRFPRKTSWVIMFREHRFQ
jgi:hypothetical protein